MEEIQRDCFSSQVCSQSFCATQSNESMFDFFRPTILRIFGSVLRNCGKKMPRYCDVNSDKKITLTEWLGCLQVQTTPYKPKSMETREYFL